MELLIERCDRCNAQAYVRFIKSTYELYFCGHHAARNDIALDKSGWTIDVDTRNLLTVGAEVS